MINEDFVKKLKQANLNKKDFARITELAYSTVANWSSTQSIPPWVESWLKNYIDKKKFDNIKDIIKDEID